MSDRNSGEREIPVEILEKREFRCWSGTGVLGQIPVPVRHWIEKMIMFPSVPALVSLLILKKKWEENYYCDKLNSHN